MSLTLTTPPPPPPPPPLSFSPLNNSEMAKEAVTLTFLQQSVTFC